MVKDRDYDDDEEETVEDEDEEEGIQSIETVSEMQRVCQISAFALSQLSMLACHWMCLHARIREGA